MQMAQQFASMSSLFGDLCAAGILALLLLMNPRHRVKLGLILWALC
jgi:hypothetical protein